MPYFVWPPFCPGRPYVLDDEDKEFLRYFLRWGWHCEIRSSRDPQILEFIRYERNERRDNLYCVWQKECHRRIRAEEKRMASEAKAAKTAMEQAREDNKGKVSLKTKVSKMFKKKPEKERPGYQDGLYVNHIEDLQKKWFKDENAGK